MKKLLIAILVSSSALGQAVDLKKSEPAPFEGVLLPFDYASRLRQDVEIGDLNKKKVDILTVDVTRETDRANMWMKTSQDLASKNVAQDSLSTYKVAGGFLLGVIATVLTAYAVKGATK